MWTVLKGSWVHTYDNLGPLILVNLLWCLVSLGTALLALPAATCAVCHYACQLTTYQYPDAREFWTGFRRFFWRAEKAGLLWTCTVVVLIFNMRFYAARAEAWGFVALLLFAVAFWGLALFLMISMYWLPFLVWRDLTVWEALRRAAIVALGRPVHALLTLAMLAPLGLFCLPPLLFFFPMSCAAVLATISLLHALGEYVDYSGPTPELKAQGRR